MKAGNDRVCLHVGHRRYRGTLCGRHDSMSVDLTATLGVKVWSASPCETLGDRCRRVCERMQGQLRCVGAEEIAFDPLSHVHVRSPSPSRRITKSADRRTWFSIFSAEDRATLMCLAYRSWPRNGPNFQANLWEVRAKGAQAGARFLGSH